MNIHIKYFGLLIDISRCEEEILRDVEQDSVEALIQILNKKYPELQELVYAVFVNKKKVNDMQLKLSDNDEVILMPPYSGG